MSKSYWHCPECGGNFDHGEKCDCAEMELITHRKAGKESETLIIGFDYGNGKDIPCLTVGKKIGDTLTVINVIYGKEAELMYERLLAGHKEEKNESEGCNTRTSRRSET